MRDFIDVFEVFELVDESLSGGDVHDGVVAVLPLHVDVELLDAFLVGKFEHFFMDEFSAGIELPVPILVAHSISHRWYYHAGLVSIDKGICGLDCLLFCPGFHLKLLFF